MGRPLKLETIKAMNLVTEQGSVLEKQVGFNKYLVQDSDKIVCLSEKADIVNDINYEVLKLNVKGEAKPVTKILRNVFQTVDGVFAYKLETKEVDGEKETIVVFADADVSLGTSTEEPTTMSRRKSKKSEEPKVEEPKVEEPKVEEEVVEEPTEVVEE